MDNNIEAAWAAIGENDPSPTIARRGTLENSPDDDVPVPGMVAPATVEEEQQHDQRSIPPLTRPGTGNGSIHVQAPRHSYELPGRSVGAIANGSDRKSISSVRTQKLANQSSFEQGREAAARHAPIADAEDQEDIAPFRSATLPKTEEAQDHVEAVDAALDKFLIDHFKKDLFDVTKPTVSLAPLARLTRALGFDASSPAKNAEEPRVNVRVSLAALNRMRMRRLQMKLAHQILRMHYYKEPSTDWELLLKEYIAAARDNDYIRTCIHRGIDDPFLVGTEKHVDAAILNAALLDIPEAELLKEGLLALPDEDNKRTKFNFVSPVESEPRAIGGTRMATTRKQKTQLFLQRVMFAVVGGFFLVGPMWLMAVLNTKYVSLISTSVFVFLAGLVAAWKVEDPRAVLSTTAAYAAVLVVFVGTSITPSSSSGGG